MEGEDKIKKEQHSNDLRRRARLAVMNSKRVLLSSTNDFDENEEEDGPTRKVSEEEDVTVVVDNLAGLESEPTSLQVTVNGPRTVMLDATGGQTV